MNSKCDHKIREKFQKILEENKLVIITKLGCPPCLKIKKLFNENSINYFETDINHPDYENYFYCIYEKSRVSFVPQIFLNSNYIGGYTEALNDYVKGKFNDL